MKKRSFYEILFYILIPLVIWKFGRDILGDYYAMLFSTVPGFIYTIVNFLKEKQFNVTGVFILSTLFISTAMDLIVHTAEEMLWNGVYYNMGMIVFWIITILLKRPMALYFFIDYAYISGFPRENSYKLYTKKELNPYFYYLTFFFALRDFIQAGTKAWLIQIYGVEGFDHVLMIMKILGWTFTGLTFLVIAYIVNKINQYVQQQPSNTDGTENQIIQSE